MLILRLLAVLSLLGIGGALLLWLVTGQAQYRRWAWLLARIALVVAFVFFGLLVLERVLAPLA